MNPSMNRPRQPRDEDREQLQADLTRLVGAGRLQFEEFDRLCNVVWSTQDKGVLDRIRAQAHLIPEEVRGVLTQDRPLDFRPVDAPELVDPEPAPPLRRTWFRTTGKLPDDPLIHQAALAYASDYGLLATVLQPHGLTVRDPGMQVASLDHALWFHRDFRVDDWLLYSCDSPTAQGARGLSRGLIYDRRGHLVASSAQEGLMRVKPVA